ncbi:hypothetical protein PMAYCL1PPCAC_02866 [Pristionchus mayeri]|uniref:Uncharacterized protein n=1 Tax=Pristionchus mayeri TaxID=1317129 RepID=A0AAN4Z2I2_9BILA|nr:hypothetical protein PMAYCL1PPCAC_02866 [Pristionchus mayeri]
MNLLLLLSMVSPPPLPSLSTCFLLFSPPFSLSPRGRSLVPPPSPLASSPVWRLQSPLTGVSSSRHGLVFVLIHLQYSLLFPSGPHPGILRQDGSGQAGEGRWKTSQEPLGPPSTQEGQRQHGSRVSNGHSRKTCASSGALRQRRERLLPGHKASGSCSRGDRRGAAAVDSSFVVGRQEEVVDAVEQIGEEESDPLLSSPSHLQVVNYHCY